MMRPVFDLNDLRNFDLNNFRNLVAGMKVESLRKLLEVSPRTRHFAGDIDELDIESRNKRIMTIIDSMTLAERGRPELIDASRRRRIAAGAGVDSSEVSKLLEQFDSMAGILRSWWWKSLEISLPPKKSP